MDRAEALRRLRSTTEFTLVGGRVLVRNARVLATIAELRAEGASGESARRAVGGHTPKAAGVLPS